MQPLSPDELEALRRNDARYRAVLLASAAIVWIASPDGEFVERQPIWEEYTGQSWEEYRGSRWTSVIHPDDRARVMQDWMGAVATQGPVYRTQGRIWSSKHAAWRSFQTRGVPVRDASGNIAEWVGALTDVQDTVDAIDQGRLQAERASKEKTRFLAATSHDLRQPLQSLAALIHLLAARSRDPVDAPLLSRAERAVRSMTDLRRRPFESSVPTAVHRSMPRYATTGFPACPGWTSSESFGSGGLQPSACCCPVTLTRRTSIASPKWAFAC